MSRFANLLKAAMDEAGLTAAEVAESSGLTESAISLLRAGRREPSYRTLARLAHVFPTLREQLGDREGPFDSIEDAISDIRAGKMVVVLDDEDRENEGDLVMAAQMVTPDAINFMRKHAGGLICVPMVGARLDELHIPPMVRDNTAVHETAFTVSVEARGVTTTGISAHDRAATIKKLLDPEARPADFLRPGHTFPLRARDGGVLVRAGQTEAAVDLARLAGLYPAGVICEIMAEDGTMERLEGLRSYADRHSLKLITVKDLIAYRMRTEKLVERIAEFELPTTFGDLKGVAYGTTIDENTHVALVMGEIGDGKEILVRVHSECMTGDALHSIRCDCAAQRDGAMEMIADEGRGRLSLPPPRRARNRTRQQAARLRAAGPRSRHGRGESRARAAGRQARLRHRLADSGRSRRARDALDHEQPQEDLRARRLRSQDRRPRAATDDADAAEQALH